MRPRRTRRSVTRARWPPRKITGEFSTLQHWIAGIRLAMPGPSVPMADGGLAGDAAGGFGHEPAGSLVVRRDDCPAARFRLEEQVDEVGIGNAEQRLDAFGLEQVEHALVDGRSGRCSGLRLRLSSYIRLSSRIHVSLWSDASFAEKSRARRNAEIGKNSELVFSSHREGGWRRATSSSPSLCHSMPSAAPRKLLCRDRMPHCHRPVRCRAAAVRTRDGANGRGWADHRHRARAWRRARRRPPMGSREIARDRLISAASGRIEDVLAACRRVPAVPPLGQPLVQPFGARA